VAGQKPPNQGSDSHAGKDQAELGSGAGTFLIATTGKSAGIIEITKEKEHIAGKIIFMRADCVRSAANR
jgi:hypothetical protein